MKILKTRWQSPRIVFGFTNCPQCKSIKISAPHCPAISQQTNEINKFEQEVMEKSLLRIKFEGLDKDPRLSDPKDEYYNDLQKFAMYKLAYY